MPTVPSDLIRPRGPPAPSVSMDELPDDIFVQITSRIGDPSSIGALAQTCRKNRNTVRASLPKLDTKFDVVSFNMIGHYVTFSDARRQFRTKFYGDQLDASFVRNYAGLAPVVSITMWAYGAFPWKALDGQMVELSVVDEEPRWDGLDPLWVDGIKGARFQIKSLHSTPDALCLLASFGFPTPSWNAHTIIDHFAVVSVTEELERATKPIRKILVDEPQELAALGVVGDLRALEDATILSYFQFMLPLRMPRLRHLSFAVDSQVAMGGWTAAQLPVDMALLNLTAPELQTIRVEIVLENWCRSRAQLHLWTLKQRYPNLHAFDAVIYTRGRPIRVLDVVGDPAATKLTVRQVTTRDKGPFEPCATTTRWHGPEEWNAPFGGAWLAAEFAEEFADELPQDVLSDTESDSGNDV